MVEPQFSEEFHCNDWLNIHDTQSVDLVFADGSLNMLDQDKHLQFVTQIHRMLRPGGWALMRVHPAETPQFSSAGEIFEWHRQYNSHEAVFSSTRTHLDMLWMDRRTLKIRFVEYHQRLNQLYHQQVITETEFQAYNTLLKYNRIELIYTTRKLFETMIAGFFGIKSSYVGGDYCLSRLHPIYLLQRKDAP